MKIDKRIVKYRVRKPDEKSADAKTSAVANDPDVFRVGASAVAIIRGWPADGAAGTPD